MVNLSWDTVGPRLVAMTEGLDALLSSERFTLSWPFIHPWNTHKL